MEPNPGAVSPLIQFIPLLVMSIPLSILSHELAREKGRNARRWAILGLIPVVNIMCGWFFVGAANRRVEEKLDLILKHLGIQGQRASSSKEAG